MAAPKTFMENFQVSSLPLGLFAANDCLHKVLHPHRCGTESQKEIESEPAPSNSKKGIPGIFNWHPTLVNVDES